MSVNVKYLEQCELWYGSILHTAHKFHCLRIEDVQKKLRDLIHCAKHDTLTKAEQEFFLALNKTVNEHVSKRQT